MEGFYVMVIGTIVLALIAFFLSYMEDHSKKLKK